MDTVIGKAIRYPTAYVNPKPTKHVVARDYRFDGFPPHLKKNLKKAKDFEKVLLENIDVDDLRKK